MSQYNELIRIEDEYNYSANIQFDIENDKKLLRFIPNETTIGLLKEYFGDISKEKPQHHSRILYGSYGTGKSHFLTVIAMLLGKVFTEGNAYQSFITRVSNYDSGLANDIKNYVSSAQKPMLVVPIVFDFDDFDRCIYFSLKKKLDSLGIKVCFKTFFDQAISLIENWENNKESCARLDEVCKEKKISIIELKQLLMSFDKKAEKEFQKVFSGMTFGVKYIYEVSNLSENIKQANDIICNEYSGIVFIFDEFGRYIEDNYKNIKVKAVQDLAEFCDHGDYNNHIILVSHKEISQYTQRFGKSIANEWKKVEGRYKATPINDKQDQCLSLIKNIIIKDQDQWDAFKSKYNKELQRMYSEAFDFKGFLIDTNYGGNPFEGGFPLHPISLFALDKLSKKVAQNERTFFTYLASRDDNSLYRFLTTHSMDEFHYVGIDEIFDYFEPNIKSTQSDAGFEWYKSLVTALSKNHSSLSDSTPETKILKVIATIGIINDSSSLVANKSTILSVIDCPNDVLSNSLEELCEKKILKYSGAYDRFDFFEASIFDVEEMISEESKSFTEETIVKCLNDEFVTFAIYPSRYNRNYKITRVFVPVFATKQEISKKTFLNKFGKHYDGLLIMLLSDIDDNVSDVVSLSNEVPRSIIFSNNDTEELKVLVKKYLAVRYLDTQKSKYTSKDPAFEKELSYYREEFSMAILQQIHIWKSNFESTIVASHGCESIGISDFNALSDLASTIMEEFYPDTLIVNNELINKNTISGSISSSKKNVISNIIQGSSSETYYDTSYLSPDYIAVRSVLTKNGFINTDDAGFKENVLYDGRKPQESVSLLLTKCIQNGKTEVVRFEDLINKLKEPPFGLRSGYLSLLLAHFLNPYRKSIIVSSHGVEQELSVDLFEEIVRRPQDFVFTIADWSKEQTDYFDTLEQIFYDFIDSNSLSKNRLKALYDAMLSHYKNISKFARTTKEYVSDTTIKYRTLLEKSSTNYSNFLFEKLLQLGGNYKETIRELNKIKNELDGAAIALSRDISNSICTLLGDNSGDSLSSVLISEYNNNWISKRVKSFDYYTNSFLDLVSQLDKENTDYQTVLLLSKSITGFEILFWNDPHKEEFLAQIKEIVDKLSAYHESDSISENETKMILKSANGEEKVVIFDRNDLGSLGKAVKNKITATFNNYGLAISYDEKVQVLLSVLEDLMKGQ